MLAHILVPGLGNDVVWLPVGSLKVPHMCPPEGRESRQRCERCRDSLPSGPLAGPGRGVPQWCCFFSWTMASMTATAVMLTMSRTLHSKSVKWIGLLSPIWMGPTTSASSAMSLIIL